MARSTRTVDLNAGPRGASRSFGNIVDTYVQPAATKSNLRGLADALGVAGGAVATEQARLKEEQKKQDERLGQMEGLALSMNTDPSKIKAGEMFPQASPAFMAGLRQSQSQAWAYQTLRDWAAEYETWDGKDSNNPGDYQAWMGQKLQEAREAIGDDQFAIAGALPILQQGINNMSGKHTAYTADRVKKDEMTAMGEITLGIMETHSFEDDPTGERLMMEIATQADIRVNKGLNGTEVNQKMVDDVLNYADAMNDTRFLAALAKAHDSGKYRLTPAQMKQVDDMRLNIQSEMDAVAADNAAAAKKQAAAQKDAALTSYHQGLLEDRFLMPDPSLPQDTYKAALSIRSAYNQALNTIDPDAEAVAFAKLNAVIYEPGFEKLPYNEKIKVIAPLLASPDMQLSESSIGSVFRVLGATNDPKSPLGNTTVSKLRGNATSAMKSLGGGIATLGDENQLAVAFQSSYDMAMINFDVEGKTPVEIRDIHNAVVKDVMLDLLSKQETRFTLIDNFADNPALAEQFGLGDYMKAYYDSNPGQQAIDELELIEQTQPEEPQGEETSIIEDAVDAVTSIFE